MAVQPVPTIHRTNELSDTDRAAGILSDEVVVFGAGRVNQPKPDHPVRLVTISATRHRSRGGYGGPRCDGTLRIATNRLDLPAELIGEIYRLRWLIELFFRMFKQMLGCRHLLSTKQSGVEIQVYCAIIACLLIMLSTGRRPAARSSSVNSQQVENLPPRGAARAVPNRIASDGLRPHRHGV